MAWWDGDAIDYDSDWYQENDSSTGYQGDSIDYDNYTGDVYTPPSYESGGNNNNIGVDYTPGVYETNTAPYTPTTNPLPSITMKDIGGTLSGIFSNPSMASNALKLAAVLAEGSQNKKKQQAMNALAKNPALDPFGSQRPFYQQQAQQAVTNPYDSPIVKAQIAQLQAAQDRKDAAAGRRSNSLMSAPAVQAEMAKIAMQYQDQMARQGGSQFGPSGMLGQALMSGANAGVNGYVSPAISGMSSYLTELKNDEFRKKYLEAINKFTGA